MHARPFGRLLPLLASLFAGLLSAPIGSALAQAQSTPDTSVTLATEQELSASAELSEITRSINLSEERAAALREEIATIGDNRAEQNAALIAAGARIKSVEDEVREAEGRLRALLTEENEIRLRLDGEEQDIANLLSALQRISQNPPPALVINPSDAVNAARTATLLSAVVPGLNARAEEINADLQDLISVRVGVERETSILTSRLTSLQEEQLRIATLIEARKLGLGRAEEELEAEELTAAELAAEAQSLQQLIDALRTRIDAVDSAAEAAEGTQAPIDGDAPTAEQVRVALLNTERTEPAYSISLGQGHLSEPASGVTITEFGEDDGFGGISKGLFVVTRAEAQVVAPVDAWVIYQGPYLNYGKIIIFNAGEDHTILLAGLDDVSVELGSFVLQGEPVGTMGSRTFGQTLATSAGVSRPTLYIEFRNQNLPFDPAIMWAAPEPTVSAEATQSTG